MHLKSVLMLSAIGASAISAHAQSFNVDFGSADSSPDATYAGVGLAGVWNTFESMPNFQRLPLVGLDGNPIAADIMNIGFDAIEGVDVPGTSGGDEALLDDCYVSFNDPIDGCLFMRFVEPGEYRVIMYGIDPTDVSVVSVMTIDQNADPSVMVGGGWSGAHEQGVTYMSQLVTVGVDGRLDIHSGLQSSFTRSVCNGIQVVQLPLVCPADLTGDGELNFFDVSVFLNAYTAMDPIADMNGDGGFDFFDVSAFLNAYNAGCP